jgi:hypothetical protein
MTRPIRRSVRAAALCGLLLPLAVITTLGISRVGAGSAATSSPESASSQRTAVPQASQADIFIKQPYLIFRGDPTTMQVLWQLTSTSPALLEWGADTTYAAGSVETAEYGGYHQHTFTIPDLTPGAHYDYQVTAAGTSYRGSFTAAPDPSAQDLEFFAYGDTRSYPSTHDQVAAAMVNQYTTDPSRQTFVLSVGDLVNNGNNESDWTTQFFDPSYPNIRRMMANLPYLSCMGNHDGSGALFTKYFPYPFAGGRYWSFDYGPAHIAIVDQYTNYYTGSPQYVWLENDLASTSKPWKFICLHEPGWSAGGDHENNVAVQNYIQPLCLQYGVQIVFGGHNHYYARAVVDGVQHITTGGGGAPLYSPNLTYPYIVAGVSAYHYCEIDISGHSLALRAIRTNGAVIDSFTLVTSGVPEPEPSWGLGDPHPNPFQTQTVIDWNPQKTAGAALLIVDVSGRIVRRFAPHGNGVQSAHWDGTDQNGRPVSSGIYFARIEGTRGVGRRIVLTR